MKKIVITGPIASGKSTIRRLFEELGAHTISADEVVHQLLSNNPPIINSVVELLGQEIMVEGKVDRKKIAEKVFQNPPLLRSLETILHPEVQRVIEKEAMACKQRGTTPLFVAEIPLFFEGHFTPGDYDSIVLIDTPHSTCKERFVESRRGTGEEFEERSKRLLPMEEKRKQAHQILLNNRDQSLLKEAVESLYSELTQQS